MNEYEQQFQASWLADEERTAHSTPGYSPRTQAAYWRMLDMRIHCPHVETYEWSDTDGRYVDGKNMVRQTVFRRCKSCGKTIGACIR